MHILLNLHYAKYSVSNLFLSKVIKEKPLEVGSTAPLVKEGSVKMQWHSIHVSSATINHQFSLTFRRVLSYRKEERSLLLINILETLVM